MSTEPVHQRIAMIGTVGVPASYGGFETLVENLVLWHEREAGSEVLTVYCSAKAYESREEEYHGARLVYVPLKANGAQSIPYDIWSMLSALRDGQDTLLVLGVSGAMILPLVRLFSRVRIITNIDGIEWKRGKWGRIQRAILKWSEALAVRYSHRVIADNGAIADYVRQTYSADCAVIAYGGDHALAAVPKPVPELNLPEQYAFKVCRIEPENNVHMILEAFADRADLPIVIVGNWDRSAYGAGLKARYKDAPGVRILDAIYDLGKLHTLRKGAQAFVHGHSAGGTNPSLVEMMFFGLPVLAYDCSFNRYTTDDRALYFSDADDLRRLLDETGPETLAGVGAAMLTLAQQRYTWTAIGAAYFGLLRKDC